MSVAEKEAPSRLGALILVWLLSQGEGGTRGKLDSALKMFLEQRWSDAERCRAVDEEIAALEQAGRIARRKRTALVLCENGRRDALAALGVKSLPAKTKWMTVKKKYLVARALEVPAATKPAAARKASPGDLRAAVLARHHQLDVSPGATLNQVRDALAWRVIGVETGKPFVAGAVIEVLLGRMLGATQTVEAEKALERLAAKAMGALRSGVEEIEKVILRRWIDGAEVVPAAPPQERTAPSVPTTALPPVKPRIELPVDDGAFARRVLAAARGSKTGRFGDNEVFISHVLRQLAAEGFVVEDVASVKARLVSVHRGGLLSLSRADLVEAMAAADVDTSETRYLNATFHFVRI